MPTTTGKSFSIMGYCKGIDGAYVGREAGHLSVVGLEELSEVHGIVMMDDVAHSCYVLYDIPY
jgi:hypothetical protein